MKNFENKSKTAKQVATPVGLDYVVDLLWDTGLWFYASGVIYLLS